MGGLGGGKREAPCCFNVSVCAVARRVRASTREGWYFSCDIVILERVGRQKKKKGTQIFENKVSVPGSGATTRNKKWRNG